VDPDLPDDLLGAAAVKTDRFCDRFAPWSGIAFGTLGAGLAHQLGSDATFQDCSVGSPAVVIIATILGLALIGLGALGSWRVYSGEREGPARHLVATVSLLCCALFALAVILPFIASMLIPRCWH
jgi:hypothetical protein